MNNTTMANTTSTQNTTANQTTVNQNNARNNPRENTSRNYFYCYSQRLTWFCQAFGLRYVTVGINHNTLTKYHTFEKSPELNAVIDLWNRVKGWLDEYDPTGKYGHPSDMYDPNDTYMKEALSNGYWEEYDD